MHLRLTQRLLQEESAEAQCLNPLLPIPGWNPECLLLDFYGAPQCRTGWEPCDIDLFSPWQQQIKTTSKTEGRPWAGRLHNQSFTSIFFSLPPSSLHFHKFHIKVKVKIAPNPSGRTALWCRLWEEAGWPSLSLKHQTRSMEKSQTTMLGNFICWLSIHIFGKCVWT